MLTDRLAYIVTTDPRQAVAGFGQVGAAASKATKSADAEMARLQKRVDSLARQEAAAGKRINALYGKATRAGDKGDVLGADVLRIKAKNAEQDLLRLQARSRDAAFALESAQRPAKGLRSSLAGVGLGGEAAAAGLALATAAAVKFGVDAAFSADRQATAQRGTKAVFKDSADEVLKFGKQADQSLGLAETAALSATTGFGNLFTKAGTKAEEAAKLAKGLTSLTAVLAAAHPEAGNTEDALVAIQAALRGEFDPLEKFKVKINATRAEQKALQLGLAATTAGLTEQDKQLATLQLLFEETRTEQGLFADNTETLAFKQQQANAAVQDFKDAIGKGLIKDVAEVAEVVGTLANAMEGLAGVGEGEGVSALLRLFDVTGIVSGVSFLAEGFNSLFGSGSDAKDVLADVNELNVAGRAKALAAAASSEEQAAALKKVTAAGTDALSAAEALVDVDDRIAAAKKDIAEAADDEAEKARDLTDARRDEADAGRKVADAEEAIARARREAPRDLERARIAARSAQRAQADAQADYEKMLRRRGATDPKTVEAQDKLALATFDTAEAQERLNDLQGKGGIPKAVQDAISARDAALRAREDAEKRTAEVLARNPYEAQQRAAKELRDAERDRLSAVATLNEKLALVSAEIRAGFDATKATKEQVEAMVTALGKAVAKQAELNALRATDLAAALAARNANPGPLATPGAQQVTPAPGINPATGIPFVPGASARAASVTTVQAQYTGPITVQASDPSEFQRQLEAKQRWNRLGGI